MKKILFSSFSTLLYSSPCFFALSSSPSCYSLSFPCLLLFVFFRFSVPYCPFHVLIILLLLVPFSSCHSVFFFPSLFNRVIFSLFCVTLIFITLLFFSLLFISFLSVVLSLLSSRLLLLRVFLSFLRYIIHSLPAS